MASVFSRIIDGDLPGHFIWADPVCVGFLSIGPLTPGHALVVPRAEVDEWTDLDEQTCAHLMLVAHRVAAAIKAEWSPARVGLVIAGFEVPHTHVHVFGADTMGQFDFANAASSVDHAELAGFAQAIRGHLGVAGFAEQAVAPESS